MFIALTVCASLFISINDKPAPMILMILKADMTPEARMKALEPFLNIGMKRKDAERVLGRPSLILGMGLFGMDTSFYSFENGSLIINTYPDDEIYRIAYSKKGHGPSVTLRSDTFPVGWPKTENEHNAKLREWMKR